MHTHCNAQHNNNNNNNNKTPRLCYTYQSDESPNYYTTENLVLDTMSDQDQDTEEPLNDSQHQLIPPFLLNQKVFTCNLEKLSPAEPPKSDLPQQNNSDVQQYFEAVVKQVRQHPHLAGNGRWTFLIHFKGWNARYDRWMAASQLVADTPESRQHYEQQLEKVEAKRQAEVEAQKQKQKLAKKQRKQPTTAKPKTAATTTVSQPFPDDSLVSTLPFTLKIVLTEEWESINRKGYEAILTTRSDKSKGSYPARCVHVLPAAVTIRQLIKHFEKKMRKDFKQKQEKELQRRVSQQDTAQEKDSTNKEAQQQQLLEKATNQHKLEVRQFCSGLAKLFEEALPKCLLYAQERPQYQHYVLDKRQRGEKVSLLDIYGCEFLLRLIVRLPILLVGKRPPSLVSDLIVVLQQSRTTCFKGVFRRPEYPHEWLDWEREYFGDPTKK